MRAATLTILGIAACGLGQTRWQAKPEQLAPMPVLSPKASSSIEPLALEPGAAQTSWPDIGAARKISDFHYLDRARIHDETSTFLRFIDTFYLPLTAETKLGFKQAHQDLSTLENLTPYAIWSVTLAFQQSTQRLNLCILNAGVTAPCFRDLPPRAPRTTAFEVGELSPDIGLLTVHDLRDAGDPAWRDFGAAADALATRRGLVIDLRGAIGSDPRALMPWVALLAGRADLKPLRAIERPSTAKPYVDAYAAKFTDRGRNPQLWSSLVGRTGPQTAAPTAQPIAILVGPQCEAACELIARVLETYAGATVTGGVTRAGRLARDEPAMFVLPHSQTTVYFHATRYLLSAEIEAATGPTEEWTALVHGDGVDPVVKDPAARDARFPYPVTDFMTHAKREVAHRIANPAGWPRCDSLPATLPAADSAKLHGVINLTHPQACDAGYRVTILTPVPASAMRRFLATCSTPVESHAYLPGEHSVRTPVKPSPALLAQIAASELVDNVSVECQHRYHLD